MRSIIDALDFSVVAGLGHTSVYCNIDGDSSNPK